MKRKQVSIALIDDHDLFRQTIEKFITTNRHIKIIMQSSGGRDFMQKMAAFDQSEDIDIVVTDINMKEIDGFDVVRWLQKYHPKIKVVVLTLNTAEMAVLEMLHHQVAAYLSKNGEAKTITNALNCVASSGSYYDNFFDDPSSIHAQDHAASYDSLSDSDKILTGQLTTSLPLPKIAQNLQISRKMLRDRQTNLFNHFGVSNRAQLTIVTKLLTR